MKIAKVIPIFKSKEHDLLTNYRPISLLPALSKILEKVMHKRLYSFLEKIMYYINISISSGRNGLQ